MKLDQLQQIIDRMTSAPWSYEPSGVDIIDGAHCTVHGREMHYPTAMDSDDADGVIALRNHASALVECAKLLEEARQYLPRDHFVVSYSSLVPRVDAALKRLEEIK
jgi:hypothetical protein